ncbi:MAG: hypothetical protein JOZ19_04400 [Rubrobacter sp.]|nr:hypothetical protein [Rubrobacter sp.]
MKLFFVHIPKTGGCSLSDCLGRMYSAKSFTFTGNFPKDLERYKGLSNHEKEKTTLITGHTPLTTEESELDLLPKITFLRDPVERVKSFCQHVSEGKSPYIALREHPPERFDVDRFLDSGNPELSNLQTKILLGRGSYNIDLHDPDLIVEKATEVLENKLVYFGLTEYFDESLMLFRKALGWGKWPVYTKLNTKNEARLITFSKRNICKIRELNKLDMRVYDVATELFTQRAQENVAYLERSLQDFRKVQDAFLKRSQINDGINRLKRIIAGASCPSAKHLLSTRLFGSLMGISGKDY